MIDRTRLLHSLDGAADVPAVAIVAPPGYGKTTVLAQWIERLDRPSAWLSIDHTLEDPANLLFHLAAAFRRSGMMSPSRYGELRFSSTSALSHGVTRLVEALEPINPPGVLVLDHLDSIHHRASRDVVAEVHFRLEGRVQLVAASRSDGRLPVGVLRSRGAILEIGASDLAMDESEARSLLDQIGVNAGDDLAEIMYRTEGWPVGIYLTGLALQGGSTSSLGMAVGGDDLYIADYLRSEVLDRLSESRVSFLTRTSILDQLSGPLCDAVLDASGSARLLEDLEQSNLLIVRLDRKREWHRYHHMFQDLLKAELQLREPDLVPTLHQRAAAWYEAQGMPALAIQHAQAAQDVTSVTRMVQDIGRTTYTTGRADTLLGWLEWLDGHGALGSHPGVAAMGALVRALAGDSLGAERWADVSMTMAPENEGDESFHPVARLVRALRTQSGLDAMLEDARMARTGLPPGSEWTPAALAVEGLAMYWRGEVHDAEALFTEAISLGEPLAATATATISLAERGIIAASRGDWSAADSHASHSLRMVLDNGLESYTTSGLTFAVAARCARKRGDIAKARRLLAQASGLRPQLNSTLPGIAVQTHLEMARAYVELSDFVGARTVLRDAHDVLIQRPDLGDLPQQIQDVKAHLQESGPGTVGPSALTTAELRLLPLLTTHLSFPEIGERLYVSRHTVKTQAMSIYRKLGASSRSEAVARARSAGLLGT
jgi:LuxR family maltose regulon positive regulatory protein